MEDTSARSVAMAAGLPAALAVVRLQQGRVADAGPLVRQEASLVLGRVLRVKGDTAGAREWALLALAPLAYGNGAGHPRRLEARALGD